VDHFRGKKVLKGKKIENLSKMSYNVFKMLLLVKMLKRG
jgi:hypothetical protein